MSNLPRLVVSGEEGMTEAKQETVEAKVRTLLASEEFGVSFDEITGNAHLTDDLGLDSIDCVEFAIILEEEFGIAIPDDDFDELLTVSSICAYIEKHRRS
jgi:acyl carrier protein